MPTRTAVIASSVGLHARPAGLFVGLAGEAVRAGVTVTIGLPGEDPVNAASILSVLALGARHGDTVEVSAEGEDADGVLARLVAELSTDRDAAAS
ncbi:phosphocarrier protein HPr [Marmoricola sp. URHA0025 HA25]